MHEPSWLLQSHQYKRNAMNRVDAMRVEMEQRHKHLSREIDAMRQRFAIALTDLQHQLKQDSQYLLHESGRCRQELKLLPVLPLPGSWQLPEFQYGSKVFVTKCKLVATVVGMLYCNGSDSRNDYVGWSYHVQFDYAPLPHDDVEMFYEDELQQVGAIVHCNCNALSRSQTPESDYRRDFHAILHPLTERPLGNNELFQEGSRA